tara:strand:- start:11204 stop:11968 length:765 start_codon:yes stop_codon:yes gene_type:complete
MVTRSVTRSVALPAAYPVAGRSRPLFLRNLFSPAALFASGEKGAWFDPSDLATLFQDAAGTIPVTAAGQSVALILDKSGNGNHASQSATARRPTLRQDTAGRHYLYLDGVDDFMQAALPGGSYMASALRMEKTGTTLHCAMTLSLSQNINAVMRYHADLTKYRVGSGYDYAPGEGLLVNGVVNGSFALNETHIVDSEWGGQSGPVDGVIIGSNGGLSHFWGGRFYEMVIRGPAVTGDDALLTRKYLAGIYGVAL